MIKKWHCRRPEFVLSNFIHFHVCTQAPEQNNCAAYISQRKYNWNSRHVPPLGKKITVSNKLRKAGDAVDDAPSLARRRRPGRGARRGSFGAADRHRGPEDRLARRAAVPARPAAVAQPLVPHLGPESTYLTQPLEPLGRVRALAALLHEETGQQLHRQYEKSIFTSEENAVSWLVSVKDNALNVSNPSPAPIHSCVRLS